MSVYTQFKTKQATTTNGVYSRFKTPTVEKVALPPIPEAAKPTIIQKLRDSRKGVSNYFAPTAEVRVRDVLREMVPTTGKFLKGVAETFAPAITNFAKTTGGIFGEGLAYAIDPNVREQYKRGNTDILPTVSATSVQDLTKDTLAAGLEAAVLKYIPKTAKLPGMARFGVGSLQGLGFAISEGLAKDHTPEQIIENAKVYGVLGGTLEAIAPVLMPLLRTELKKVPSVVKQGIKDIWEQAAKKEGLQAGFAKIGPDVPEPKIPSLDEARPQEMVEKELAEAKNNLEIMKRTPQEGDERVIKDLETFISKREKEMTTRFPDSSLLTEAKKYKTAEEFVKAVENTGIENRQIKNIPISEINTEFDIYKRDLPKAFEEIRGGTARKISNEPIRAYYNISTGKYDVIDGYHRLADALNKGKTEIKAGIEFKSNVSGNQTKSQLTAIWEKANKITKPLTSGEEAIPKGRQPELEARKLAQGEPASQANLPPPTEPPSKVSSSFFDDSDKIKKSQTINTSKLNISDEAKKLIDEEYGSIKPQIEGKVGKRLTNQEARDLAEQSSKILERAVGREQTLEWEAAMLKLRQRLANAAESGQVTQEFLDDLLTVRTLGTDVGRKLQSLSVVADPKAVTAKQAILSDILKLTDNTDEILRAAKDVDFNNFKQASEFYRQFVKPSLLEWVDLLRYNSMLSSPLTHMVNIFSNLANSTLRAPLTKLVAGGLDLLSSSVLKKARTQFAGEAGAYIAGYLKNTGEAFKRFVEVWKGTRAFTHLDLRQMPLSTKGAKATVEKVLSVPMRLLEGADQFFMALTESGERAALELRQGKGVKVKGLMEKATQEARYGLFRQELSPKGQGTLLNALDAFTAKILSLRNHPNPIVSLVSKFTVPFVSTPMNIFKQGIEYSPMGFATAIKSANKVEQLAKAMIGTGVATLAGTLIASNRMTWAEPTSQAEKNAWRENGQQPYSVKIGNRWYSYQKLPPFISFPLSMIAAVNDAVKNKKLTDSNAELVLTSFAKYAEFLADQSYFKSIGDFFAAVSGDEFAIEKLVGNYPQQLVPFRAFGGWLARLSDGLQRQIDNKAGFIDKQMQLLMMNVPFVTQRLESRRGPSGEPIEQRDRIIGAVSPVRTIGQTPKEAETIESAEELKRINRQETQKSALLKEEAITLDEELQSLSKEEANARFKQIKAKNPALAEKLKDVVSERKLGLTYTEKLMKQLGVENGERAKYIDQQIMKLPTSEERNAYYNKLRKKKIITDEVAKQIKKLRKKAE